MHRQKKRPLKKLCFCTQAQAENTGVVSLQPQLACELCGRAAVPSSSCLIFGESPLTTPKRPGSCPGESWHVGPGSPSVPIVTAVVDILAQCRSSVISETSRDDKCVSIRSSRSPRWSRVHLPSCHADLSRMRWPSVLKIALWRSSRSSTARSVANGDRI